MAEQATSAGKIEQLKPSDPRLAVAAELVASDGEVLGKAVVLSQNLAVTTASVAAAARSRVEIASKNQTPKAPAAEFGPLRVVFPQYQSILPKAANVEAVDGALRFGVLSFYGQTPLMLSPDLLGTGELPADGAESSVIYADDPLKAFYRIAGQIENRAGEAAFYLYLETLPPDQSQLTGAPVFYGNRLIGIVVGGPARAVSGSFLIDVLSVRGMALSKVTPAVRELLPWIDGEGVSDRQSSPQARSAKDGAVGTVATPQAVEVYYSFSQKDDRHRKQLEQHLSALQSEGLITSSHSREIDAGVPWVEQTDKHLNSAGIVLLLVSTNYLASEFCMNVEAKRAMKRGEAGTARVIPVILEPCDWYGAPFAKLQALPTDARPIATWRNRDEAYNDVAAGIRRIVESIWRETRLGQDEGSVVANNAKDGAPDPVSVAYLSDAEIFGRLSESGRKILERAYGMRTGRQTKIHMELLLGALFEGWKGFFGKSTIDEAGLRKIIKETARVELPLSSTPIALTEMPPLSAHAREALMHAARYADERGAKQIWSTHLLHGALSVEDCRLIKALNERGMRREDIPSGSEEKLPTTPGSEAWFGRLSASAMLALERANGIRLALQWKEVHVRHLVAGLFAEPDGPTRGLFSRARVGETELRAIFQSTARMNLLSESEYKTKSLTAPPPCSDKVEQAFENALRRSYVLQSDVILHRHLLYGVLSVEGNLTTRALRERGVMLMDLEEVRDSPLEVAAPKPDNPPDTADFRAPTASPTPKVDSDLWCEEDRLGYEAYARTIASLITHEETVPPLTIGIKAPWGAGKTSLMKRVQHLLDGYAELTEESRTGILQEWQPPQTTLRELLDQLKATAKPNMLEVKRSRKGEAYGLPPRTTVWFNAWKYQTSEQIWAGMAHCIISQVTARMSVKDRELFWLRLHARRVNVEEVRKKVYEVVLRQIAPMALLVLAVCVIAIWLAVELPAPQGSEHGWLQWWRYVLGGVPAICGAFQMRREWAAKLGEKAAGTVRELIREPDYEGKMGYLHLVESDIREVLDLVTTASAGDRAPDDSEAQDQAESSVGTEKSSSSRQEREKDGATAESPLLATPARSGAPGSGQGQGGQPLPSFARPDGRGRPSLHKIRKDPLVVFVDDLDRCAPNKVAEVVEAINLFLCGDYPNCIFVVGMEPGMVAAALEVANKDVIAKAQEMGLVDGAAPVGWRFMEKIVQLPIMIPPPTKGWRKLYVEWLVGSAVMPAIAAAENSGAEGKSKSPPNENRPSTSLRAGSGRGTLKDKVPFQEHEVQAFMSAMAANSLAEVEKKGVEIVEAAAPEKKPAAAEASKRMYEQAFSERDPLIADFVSDVAELVDGNPRQIKRYVNVFRFYSTLRHSLRVDGTVAAGELPSDKVLAKFVALSIQWPHAVDCLRAKKEVNVEGKALSWLQFLETESAKITTNDAAADEQWQKVVGDCAWKSWAQARAFREFLKRGELLGQSQGHGLW
jgi:hypothetical protein